MKHEFKVTKSKEQTVYTLESATGGSTSAGSIASVSTTLGGMQRRPKDSIFAQEEKAETPKPRNFVAKNAKMGGAGKMKDKSKTIPRHEKHKKPVAEGLNEFAPDNSDGGEEDTLLKFARMWYNGDDVTQQRVEQALARSGWEIGEIESEEGGAFVVQAGDENGDSYIGFNVDDLTEGVAEEWSHKYKSSINCSHPKGFSQKAHCAGKKKHEESMMTMEAVCPDCGMCETHGDNMMEVKQRLDAKCWKGYRKAGTKMKGGVRVNNCVPTEGVEDHEIKMASSELQSIAKNAVHLLDLVRKYSEQEGLQAWQQSKITKAADYLNSVLQSISGEQSALEGLGKMRGNPGAYDADVRASQSGMSRPHDHRGLGQELAHETNNYAVAIDGRTWKVFADQRQAQNIAKSLQAKGKKATVHPTGANPTESMEQDAYMMELASKVAEKLNPSDPTDVWVQDFQKADPKKYHQFKNKTPQKKAQMAVAAHYAANEPSKKN